MFLSVTSCLESSSTTYIDSHELNVIFLMTGLWVLWLQLFLFVNVTCLYVM